nr:hypothetical protein [Tanacetum cinerariifolium]
MLDKIDQTLKRIEQPRRMPPKRTSTSVAPAMNQAAIWQLIDDRVAAALEAQAANMAIRPETVEAKELLSLYHSTKARDEISFKGGGL